MNPETRKNDAEGKASFGILCAISCGHLINDTIQAVLPSIYPLLKHAFNLDFVQVGLITLCFQLTASILQPVVGFYTDKRPVPFSLAAGMVATLCGLILLSFAWSFPVILISAALIGIGSSVFHPEASRLARMASGGQHGFAQSLFQVGGNGGSALGPLLAALIIGAKEQHRVLWFGVAAVIGIVLLWKVGIWYRANLWRIRKPSMTDVANHPTLPARKIVSSVLILMALIFSKYFYLACMTSYYTFFLIAKFHFTVRLAQIYLFIFLFAVAAGTIIGGPVGDRIGRKKVIWVSILGVAPFTLLLPYADPHWIIVLSVCIGLILASAFSAILVYAQELMPGKVGMVSGLFFGFAFGMGGIGSAVLGELADRSGILYVFSVCSFLPLIGILTMFLPTLERKKAIHT